VCISLNLNLEKPLGRRQHRLEDNIQMTVAEKFRVNCIEWDLDRSNADDDGISGK